MSVLETFSGNRGLEHYLGLRREFVKIPERAPAYFAAVDALTQSFPQRYHNGAKLMASILGEQGTIGISVYLDQQTIYDEHRKGLMFMPLGDSGVNIAAKFDAEIGDDIKVGARIEEYFLVRPDKVPIRLTFQPGSIHLDAIDPEGSPRNAKNPALYVCDRPDGSQLVETSNASRYQEIGERMMMRVERSRRLNGPRLVVKMTKDDYSGTEITLETSKTTGTSMKLHRKVEGKLPLVEPEIYDGHYSGQIRYGGKSHFFHFLDGFDSDQLAVLASIPGSGESAARFLTEGARIVWDSFENSRLTVDSTHSPF